MGSVPGGGCGAARDVSGKPILAASAAEIAWQLAAVNVRSSGHVAGELASGFAP
jgi:hypothetical protein